MGKRKASVFTVVESVNHWMEANCRIPAFANATQEESTPIGVGLGPPLPFRSTTPATTPIGVEWSTPVPYPLTAEPNSQVTGGPRAATVTGVAILALVEVTSLSGEQPLEEMVITFEDCMNKLFIGFVSASRNHWGCYMI